MPEPRHKRSAVAFTMVEILVVMAILAMILAVVVPKLGGTPLGLRVAGTFSTVRNAFNAAGTQARASGQPVRLYIDLYNHRLVPERVGLPQAKMPGALQAEQPIDPNAPPSGSGALFNSVRLYTLDTSVVFDLEAMDPPESREETSYLFMPGGEAIGPRLHILVGPRRFTIDVDRLTGKPIIREVED